MTGWYVKTYITSSWYKSSADTTVYVAACLTLPKLSSLDIGKQVGWTTP